MRRLLLLLAFSLPLSLSAQTITFLEPGTSATYDSKQFTGGASCVFSATVIKTPSASLQCIASRFAATPSGVLSDAGSRVSFYWETDSALSTTAASVLRVDDAAANTLFEVQELSGALVLGCNSGGGGFTPSINTPYRISLAYSVTSTTVYTINFYVNGTLISTGSGCGTLPRTGSSQLRLLNFSSGNNRYFSDIYVDNGSDGSDPGDVRVTAKLPASADTNNWNTVVGTCTNWDCVNNRPLDTTLAFEETAGNSQVQESFGIQALGAGDVDLTGATILGHSAWVYAKAGTETAGVDQTTSNSSVGTAGTTLACTLSALSANDVIQVAWGDQVGGSSPTIADGKGLTWTADPACSTNTVRHCSWYAPAGSNTGSDTITVTFGSSSGSRAMACGSFKFATATPLDANPANSNVTTSPYNAPATGVLTQASEYVVGTYALAGPVFDTVAAGASDTLVSAGTNGGQAFIDSGGNNVNGTGTSLTYTPTKPKVNDLIACSTADQKGGTAPSVADNASAPNSWTTLTVATNTVRCQGYFTRLTDASLTTVTATVPSTNASAALSCMHFSGALATPKDVNPALLNDSTSPYTSNLSGTLAQAAEVLVSYTCLAGPSGDTIAASTNTTAIVKNGSTGGSATTNSTAVMGYNIVAATTSLAMSITDATSNRTGTVGIAGFKLTGNAVTTDSIAGLTYRTVAATTSVQPQMTDATNRTGVAGTASFKINSATPQIVDNGSGTNLTLTSSYALYTALSTNSTYPSNIGMKSQAPQSTFWGEGGQIIAFRPAAPAATKLCTIALLGAGPC